MARRHQLLGWGTGLDLPPARSRSRRRPSPPFPPVLDTMPGGSGRWWWLGLLGLGFAAVLGDAFAVQGHLSDRGLLTIAIAGLLVVVLMAHRSTGRRLRALGEYAVVATLVVLLATLHPAGQPHAKPHASADTVPAVVRAAAGVRDWLAQLWRQAGQQADRHASPPTTTTRPTPTARGRSG
jgi:hypothetical protein